VRQRFGDGLPAWVGHLRFVLLQASKDASATGLDTGTQGLDVGGTRRSRFGQCILHRAGRRRRHGRNVRRRRLPCGRLRIGRRRHLVVTPGRHGSGDDAQSQYQHRYLHAELLSGLVANRTKVCNFSLRAAARARGLMVAMSRTEDSPPGLKI
jgi:hypothetical protein